MRIVLRIIYSILLLIVFLYILHLGNRIIDKTPIGGDLKPKQYIILSIYAILDTIVMVLIQFMMSYPYNL